MDLFIQFGYGMMSMSKDLIDSWDGGTVILSPRDLEYKQIEKVSKEINESKGNIVIDPQFYLPRSNHENLNKHLFWPAQYETALFDAASINEMLTILNEEYNAKFDSSFFILPGHYSSEINEDWNTLQLLMLNEAKKINFGKDIYATVCLSHEVLGSEAQLHEVLEYIEDWEVEGIYLLAEPPNNSYLIQNPNWLLNLLDICSGIKLQHKKLVVGYSNHQLLCLAAAKVDAIASGNFLNVRSFNTARFNATEGGGGRRSKWYYCPQALSEYQITFLDMAHRQGLMEQLLTDESFNSTYSDILFAGAQPTTTEFKEGNSFKHYLQCLKVQSNRLTKPTYDATKNAIKIQLETADRLTEFLKNNGVRGKNRDFSNVVDDTMSAMMLFDKLRGMRLRHRWDSI